MFLILFLIICTLGYYLGTRNFNYWRSRGVAGPEPKFFVGNIGLSLIGRKSLAEIYHEIYRKYEGHSFVGIYRMGLPTLMIREPEFLKRVLVQDFKHFHENEFQVDKDVDRITGRNPFVLKGNEWKLKRAALTTCFTSGKMKGMFPILEEVSNRMVKYVDENSSSPLESREICVRLTLDNVGACAFGVEGKCFNEENSEFRQLANDFLSPGSWTNFVVFLTLLFPGLVKLFKISFVRKDVEARLLQLVADVLRQREENDIVRNDFLKYVNDLRTTSDLFPEDIDVVAQAATFFFDGYETSSRVMSFVVYELAAHPEIQEKLRREINAVCEQNGGLTYDCLKDMTYLDACFNESMRKNPIASLASKRCTEKYTYTCTDPKYKKASVTIEPGTLVFYSTHGLQKDEEYFERPEEYIPERFLKNTPKFTFLPFGEGPRYCLGARFAMTQIKLGLIQLVRNFRMTVNEKTQRPLKFDPWYFMLQPIGGMWIDFEKINTTRKNVLGLE